MAVSAAVAATSIVTACSDEEGAGSTTTSAAPVVQLGAPGEAPRTLSGDEINALPTTPPATEADVEFVTSMIHHHQQAIEMIALVDARVGNPDIGLMAERMRVSQIDEIAQMETWLATQGHVAPDHSQGHGPVLMPGMLTAVEMAALEQASGVEFDALFLTSMIRHHEGARSMVQSLYDSGNGQEPTVFQLAEGISVDQAVEIARMSSLLAELEPA